MSALRAQKNRRVFKRAGQKCFVLVAVKDLEDLVDIVDILLCLALAGTGLLLRSGECADGLCGRLTLLGKASGDNGHAHLILKFVVKRGAKDDVRIGVGSFHDNVGSCLDVVEAKVV